MACATAMAGDDTLITQTVNGATTLVAQALAAPLSQVLATQTTRPRVPVVDPALGLAGELNCGLMIRFGLRRALAVDAPLALVDLLLRRPVFNVN